MARPLNTEYHTEVGLRILLGNVARHAAVYDKGSYRSSVMHMNILSGSIFNEKQCIRRRQKHSTAWAFTSAQSALTGWKNRSFFQGFIPALSVELR